MVKNDLLPFMQKIIAALKILSSLGCCFFNFLIFVLLPGGGGGPSRGGGLPSRGAYPAGGPVRAAVFPAGVCFPPLAEWDFWQACSW